MVQEKSHKILDILSGNTIYHMIWDYMSRVAVTTAQTKGVQYFSIPPLCQDYLRFKPMLMNRHRSKPYCLLTKMPEPMFVCFLRPLRLFLAILG